MAELTTGIEACYRDATFPVTKTYALQDCLVLDYTGYRRDVTVGRKLLKSPALPYFADSTFSACAAHYGRPDGFPGPVVSDPVVENRLRPWCRLRWPSDRLAKVELRDFNLEPRGPDDRGQTTAC